MNIYIYIYKIIELILKSNLSESGKIRSMFMVLFFVVVLSVLPFIINKLLS